MLQSLAHWPWVTDFRSIDSPLAAGLSPTEILYHSEQLASAPTFPNYERTSSLGEHLNQIEDRLSLLATQLARRAIKLKTSNSALPKQGAKCHASSILLYEYADYWASAGRCWK